MKKIEKALNIIKIIGGVIVFVGIGALSGNIVNATTPKNIKLLTKICIGIGSFIVADMVATKAVNEFDKAIDDIQNMVSNFESQEQNNDKNTTIIENKAED